jgi:hypothetical protein
VDHGGAVRIEEHHAGLGLDGGVFHGGKYDAASGCRA